MTAEDRLLLSKSKRVHKRGMFAVAGSPWRGTSDQVWAACGQRLLDPEYIEDESACRGKCKRCFR